MTIQLKGMTWDHPRGLDSVVNSNDLLQERCGISVNWEARSLLAFGDQHISEFYEDGDPTSGWIHLSYVSPEKNRNKCLTAQRVDGKTHYSFGLPE